MKHLETVHLLHKYVWKLTWHTNLSILFGEEVNKAKTSVIPWTSCFLWKTDCLQLSKCTERTEGRNQILLLNYLAPNFPHTVDKNSSVCMWRLPEKFPKFPDSGLEGDVAHKDFGSCLLLLNLLLLVWHLSSPAHRGKAKPPVSTFEIMKNQ